MFEAKWRECAWEGCTKRVSIQYCRRHARAQTDADLAELMRAGRRGPGEISVKELVEQVVLSSAEKKGAKEADLARLRTAIRGAGANDSTNGELTSDDVLHFVWQSCAGRAQDMGAALGNLNRWLSKGWRIAVYQHVDRRIEPLLAHQLVSYGSSGAYVETPDPPLMLDKISLFDGPFTLLGTYSGAALSG